MVTLASGSTPPVFQATICKMYMSLDVMLNTGCACSCREISRSMTITEIKGQVTALRHVEGLGMNEASSLLTGFGWMTWTSALRLLWLVCLFGSPSLFRLTSLVGSSLVGSSLVGSSLVGSSLVGSSLVGSSLVGSSLVGSSLVGSSLVGSSLVGSSLVGSSLVGSSLVGSSLVGFSLFGFSLVGSSLVGSSLVVSSLVGSSLFGLSSLLGPLAVSPGFEASLLGLVVVEVGGSSTTVSLCCVCVCVHVCVCVWRTGNEGWLIPLHYQSTTHMKYDVFLTLGGSSGIGIISHYSFLGFQIHTSAFVINLKRRRGYIFGCTCIVE